MKKTREISNPKELWINPTGGLGDILMLSGVLKLCIDKNPSVKYNLIRRAIYSDILKGHPAIAKIAFPPPNAQIITNDYWAKEALGKGNKRPFQVLARTFGLKTPVEETLFLPGILKDEMLDNLPLKTKKTIVIAPSSISPRKMAAPKIWFDLVKLLLNKGYFVIQVGDKEDRHVKGAYSLLGITTPQQLVALLKRCDLLIGVDNFIMHAAHLIKMNAIIVWGPTSSKVYGYFEQVHIQNSTNFCEQKKMCLGPNFPDNYSTFCPLQERHCMNGASANELYETALIITNAKHLINN